jgi:hypothetical protein
MKKYPVIFLLIFLFSAVCSFAAEEPYTHPATGLKFPSEIAGFKFVGRKDFEPREPGMGVGLTYRDGSAIVASVYLYDAGRKNIPDGVSAPDIREQFDTANEDISKTAKQNKYKNYQTVNHKSVATFGGVGYLHADHSYGTPGRNSESFVNSLFMTALKGHFVKIRFTSLKSRQNEALPRRDAFLAEISRRMTQGK